MVELGICEPIDRPPPALYQLSDRPRGIDAAETAPFGSEVVVLHEATSTVHRFSGVTAAVLRRCDGETPVEVMIAGIVDDLGVQEGEMTDLVLQALRHLAELGLIEHADGPGGSA